MASAIVIWSNPERVREVAKAPAGSSGHELEDCKAVYAVRLGERGHGALKAGFAWLELVPNVSSNPNGQEIVGCEAVEGPACELLGHPKRIGDRSGVPPSIRGLHQQQQDLELFQGRDFPRDEAGNLARECRGSDH
jgi:hypothetical protein